MKLKKIDYEPALPKFCKTCGGKMVAGRPKKFVNAYDTQTGKLTDDVEYTLRCEKLTTFLGKLGLRGYHDDLLIVDSPYNIIMMGPHRAILTVTRRP